MEKTPQQRNKDIVLNGGQENLIGAYEVIVEQPGFRKQTVSGITLVVNQMARIDVKLEIGQVTQELTVKADAQLVQTDDATVSQLINSQEIRELPIPANRNMFRLALMGGGMSRGPASSVTTSGFGPGFGLTAVFAGGPSSLARCFA